MLIDQYNRIHDYLRISLTDKCNFRCTYCMPDENISFMKHQHLMSTEEIFFFAKTFVDLGVKKIRLTGGEPLMRNDFGEIITKLSLLPVKLAITTNGYLIDKYLTDILNAGITSLNISLDTLDKDKFKSITQRDYFDRVWQNILLCIEHGIYVKMNVVVINGFNDDEIFDFVNLTKALPIHLRFIEFMPFALNNWDKDKVLSNQAILKSIEENYSLFKLQDQKSDTDKKFGIFGHAGTVSFISTLSNAFCSTCNRLRLTADGKIKNCLFGKEEFDILSAYRNRQDIVAIIKEAVYKKKEKLGGQFDDYTTLNPNEIENRSMINIGG